MLNYCYSPLSLLISYLHSESMNTSCRVLLEDTTPPANLALWMYLGLFAMTCLLEAPIYWLGLQRQLGVRKTIGAIFLVNLATHPAVTWIFPWIFAQTSLLTRDYLLVSEFFAIVVEAALLIRPFRISVNWAFFISCCANLFSWWTGLYVAGYLGW